MLFCSIKMPIDTVQWRVRIGLFHSEGTYREMKRRCGCKHQKIKIESLIGDAPFIMAVALLAMELIRALIKIVLNDLWRRDSIGFFYTLYHTSWWYSGCQQQDGKPFRHKSVSRTDIPSLTALPSLFAVCLVILLSVVRMLLIMSGDVEQNPGPQIILSVGDLSTLTNILRDAVPKWIAIGDQLGFTDGELRSIRSIPQCNTGGDQDCFRELLAQWLRQAPPNHELPTLENLASALREAREERLAYDLQQKHQDSTVTEDSMQSATNESFLEDRSASASRSERSLSPDVIIDKERPLVYLDASGTAIEALKDLQLKAPGVLSNLSNWRNLGQELGVDSERLAELEQSGKDPSQCKEEMIGLWVEKDRSASWEKLTQALDRMREHEISRRIKDTYTPQPPSQELARRQLEPAVNGRSPEADDSSIRAKIDGFELRFERLTHNARSEVEENQTSLKTFRHSLTCLPIRVKSDHLPYIKENLDDIKKAGSIEELFLNLNLYWSFLDYSLLEHIIERYGSIDLKRRMSQYVEDMVLFRKTTTVGQLIRIWPGRVEPPPNFSQVTSKLDKNASQYTLEELENLRKRFCSQYRLSDCVLMLAGGSNNSVIIFWYIPSSLASELTAAVRFTESSFFEKLGVLNLEVDGVCAFEQKYTTEGSQSLKEQSEEDTFPQKPQSPEFKEESVVQSSPPPEKPLPPKESDQQQMETEQEIQPTTQQLHALQKIQELSAVLEQKEAQLDHERREKEHFQQRVKELQNQEKEHVRHEKEEEYSQQEHISTPASRKTKLFVSDDSSMPPRKRPRLSLEKVEMLEEGGEKQSQLQQQIQLVVQQHEEEKQELLATLKQKESQLDWERKEKANLEQQLETSRREFQDMERMLQQRLKQLQEEREQIEAQLLDEKKQRLEIPPITEPSESKDQLGFEKRETEAMDKKFEVLGYPERSEKQKQTEPQPQLTECRLSHILTSDMEAHAFAENLRENQTLEELELYEITISSEGLSAIASSLQYNTSMKRLTLDHIKVSDSVAHVLASALQVNRTLAKLELWEETVSDEGFTAVASALEDNKGLKTVYVRRTKISNSGARALCYALRVNNSLEQLVLFDIAISDEGFSIVTSGLQDNKNLKQLNFRKTKISNVGANALASALQVNRTLEQLVLSNTKVPDSGTSALANALRVNQTLEQLEVDFQSVSEEGAREFVAAVEANSSLKTLKIWRPRNMSKEVQEMMNKTAGKKGIHLKFSD